MCSVMFLSTSPLNERLRRLSLYTTVVVLRHYVGTVCDGRVLYIHVLLGTCLLTAANQLPQSSAVSHL